MRTLLTLAALLVGLAFVFWAPAAKAHCPHNDDDTHAHCGAAGGGGSAPYRFVGYSSSVPADLVTGEVGLPPLYAACQDAMTGFGPAARMCTTEEFMASPNIDVPTATNAWISPTIIGFDGTTAAPLMRTPEV